MRILAHAVPLASFAVALIAGCSGSDGGAGGSGGTGGGGGAESNCMDDGACRSAEGERCTCRDCWPRDACEFNACVNDGSCSLSENCTCDDCAEAPECDGYCVPCSEFIRQFTFRGPFAPAYPPKDALCASESAALYEALEQCACEESCADECGESLCAEVPPSAACVTCYSSACRSELGACGLAVRPDILCNPVMGEPCREGEACDYLQPVLGTISGFFCFPPPSDAGLCETCNTGTGPLCANTLTCADESGGLSSGNGSCARYCCTDGDCGAGACVKGTYAPAAPDVGVCADDAGTVPACDLPSAPPSGGSCIGL